MRAAEKAPHTYLFIAITLVVMLGLGLLMIWSGAIEAVNDSAILSGW